MPPIMPILNSQIDHVVVSEIEKMILVNKQEYTFMLLLLSLGGAL